MKQKIVFCGYRDWSIEIFNFIKTRYGNQVELHLIKSQEEFSKKTSSINPKLIFFIGWSWIIEKKIVEKYTCICLHPSPLPKYRGGSPIQNQMINGEQKSAVSFFIMDEFIDKGPVVWQGDFSLEGDLKDVLDRITEQGKHGLSQIIDTFLNEGSLPSKPQDEKKANYFNRRTPEMSEIKLSDFEKLTAEEIHNKIRALQDPYPNAFVICKDGTRLYLQKSKIEKK